MGWGFGYYVGCWFIDNERINPSTGEVYTPGDILSTFILIMMSTSGLASLG